MNYLYLYAIVNNECEPIPETCLCENHYKEKNIEWHNLNYRNPIWLEFEPNFENTTLSCVVCGYPIDNELIEYQ
jgi:hypothetical protein